MFGGAKPRRRRNSAGKARLTKGHLSRQQKRGLGNPEPLTFRSMLGGVSSSLTGCVLDVAHGLVRCALGFVYLEPSACSALSPIILPTASLTAPLALSVAPLTCSLSTFVSSDCFGQRPKSQR